MSRARLPPAALVIELTEGAAVEDAARTFSTMRHLRSLGVRLAIDDFGTGYSALSYLMDMPVDILKLDKLFVDGLGADRSRHLLTRGILDLARTLNKLVIAEGIEREDQARGCTSTAAPSARGTSSRGRWTATPSSAAWRRSGRSAGRAGARRYESSPHARAV